MPIAEQTPAPQLVLLQSEDLGTRDAAWRELCDEHYTRLYRLVCRFGVEAGEVEDTVQRALVVAFERFSEVENVRDPGAWLRGITVRIALRHLRWRRVRETKRWLLRDSPITAPPVLSPEQTTSAAEEIVLVRKTLNQLSPKLRNVLVLCDIEEMKPSEAASHLGLSVETIRSRRRLAKQKFSRLWKRELA